MNATSSQEGNVWEAAKKVEIIVGICVGLITIFTSIYTFQQPAITLWLIAMVNVLFLFTGFILGRITATPLNRKPLETIGFKSSQPIDGWDLNVKTEPAPIIKVTSDAVFNNYLSVIRQEGSSYFLDYTIKPNEWYSKRVRFAVSFDRESWFYIRVRIRNNAGEERFVLFSIKPGESEPKENDHNEWRYYLKPYKRIKNWLFFDADIKRMVERTYGQHEWSLVYLEGFRLRGSVHLAFIHLF